MDAQVAPSLRTYPDPAPSDAEVSDGPAFFQPRRSQQQTLSHEEQSLANSLSHDMNGHTPDLPPQPADAQAQNFGVGVQTDLPQTPHQAPADTSMTGQHSGMDPNQDLSYGVGSDRRKRSKVSRACDECRRKKVRCDSTTSDGNVIETCSNCRRLKLTCQFDRAPMKRGPSKGYIKELAERVQQVETQMGMPITYRQSVDAASPSDPYPEPPYSPTEPLSSNRKRTFSQFDGRNPFAITPRGSRDRIAPGPRGERSSLSLIAPDQQIADFSPTSRVPSTNLAKPFWAQDTELEHPRFGNMAGNGPPIGDLWEGDSLFSAYVDLLHDQLSILPKSFEIVQHHVSKCPQKLASAFSYAVASAIGSKAPESARDGGSDFEDYVWVNAKVSPGNRSMSENLVWLWLYAFMLVRIDVDIARLEGSQTLLSTQLVRKMAMDLAHSLLDVIKEREVAASEEGLETPQKLVLRTLSCIAIFAQLHAIGTGAEDQAELRISRSPVSTVDTKGLLSEATACLAAFSSIVSLLTSYIASSAGSRLDYITNVKTRKIVESIVDTVASTYPTSFPSLSLLQELRLFISLLLARHTFVSDPTEILELTVRLVDALTTDSVNPHSREPAVARPLDVHTYTLTGLTLLELIDSGDDDLVGLSQGSLAKLHRALEQVSERAHVRLGKHSADEQTHGQFQFHWADALLRIIDTKARVNSIEQLAQDANGRPESIGEIQMSEQRAETVNGNASDKESIPVISAQQQYLISRLTRAAALQTTLRARATTMTVVDFSILTRRGYLNVLANLNGY